MNSDLQLDNQTPQNRSNKKQWVGYLNASRAWWLEGNMDFVPATRGRISLCSDRPTPYEISQTIYLLLTTFLMECSTTRRLSIILYVWNCLLGLVFNLLCEAPFRW